MRWQWSVLIGLVVGYGGCMIAYSHATNPIPYVQTYSAGLREDQLLKEIRDLLKEGVAEQKALRVEMRQQRVAVEPRPASLKAIFTTSCMPCHSEEKAIEKRIILINKDGTIPPFTRTERLFILSKVESGLMPPPKDHPPLTEATKQALSDFLFPKEEQK